MGNHRAGAHRKNGKKSITPPSVEVQTTMQLRQRNPPSSSNQGPQRTQAKSPTPSSETVNSEDSWSSSPSSPSRSPTPDLSENKPKNNSAPSTRIPPIIINASDWRKAAPSILKATNHVPQAKITADGSIRVQVSSTDLFRLIQKTLRDLSITFHTFTLPEDRTLKVIIKGIPTDISEDDISNELINLGFDVKIVRRFGNKSKPLPVCLVSLSKNPAAAEIYEIPHLFYLSVKVETYKKSGPAQCFSCQRFGHGYSNCGHPSRCVK